MQRQLITVEELASLIVDRVNNDPEYKDVIGLNSRRAAGDGSLAAAHQADEEVSSATADQISKFVAQALGEILKSYRVIPPIIH